MATATLLEGERLLSLPKAAARFPGHRGGEQLHHSTLFRWVTSGVKATTGEMVRLEAIRLGRRWVTSLEAIGRFCERLAGNDSADISPSRSRDVGADEAARLLEQLGA
jgi:hypothetical protein